MGKAAFAKLRDHSGSLQLYFNRDTLIEKKDYTIFKELLDLGDIIGVEGFLFFTRTKELSLHVKKITVLAKSLRPLPVAKEADGKIYDSFSDPEQRYRLRYLDLILNEKSRENFKKRSLLIKYIREFLDNRSFLEVETPMMHAIPGGASARPFITYHNALDRKLYLRIAPELYLKRLLVAGFPKVYEINRNFRNEGISIKHNPEFTMLELYESYGDITSMKLLCEELICTLARKLLGTLQFPYAEHQLDLSTPWESIAYLDAIEKYTAIRIDPSSSLGELKKKSLALEIDPKSREKFQKEVRDCADLWHLSDILFSQKVEPKLIQPVFITDFPASLSPLAKKNPKNPHLVYRFEPYIVGREIGNAFSELNDPVDQLKRFEKQVEKHKKNSDKNKTIKEDEASNAYIDHDYIRALEYAMPPAGGLGIGIDRLAMILTNAPSIRETILFPLLRSDASELKDEY